MSEPEDLITPEGERYASPPSELGYLDVEPPQPGHAVEIADGLLWARIPLPMELNHINVWLMEDAGGWTLVDTGMAADPCREAWATLGREVLGQDRLQRILVTHDHPDHMGLSPWLQRKHGAEVWMSAVAHQSSAEFLATESSRIVARMGAFLVMHGMPAESAARQGPMPGHDTWFEGVPELSRATAGGDVLVTQGRTWDVVETGGHCRGHLCLHDAAGRLLVSGDQVLPGISPNVSVLSSRPDADPLREFLGSLTRLEQCAPDTLVLPSHGRPFRGLHHRTADLRAHHEQQLRGLREACAEPRTAFELLPAMFGRPLRGFHRVLAMGETVAHLNYLLSAGLVERSRDAGGVIRFAGA